jgi:dTDP-4-amino-4,6-dideoxygalactose transaminase
LTTFRKSFTQQEALPDSAIAAATKILESGRLHRYNHENGEPGEVDLLEAEFAEYLGVPYCLACASGGYALQVAMLASGVATGDKVLCNAFTLAPVPGAIQRVGASPVFVDVADDYCIDLDHLAQKAADSGSKFLMLSHMRGHIADMDRIMQIAAEYSITVIEDCAHTMGASWNGRKSGTFGDVACFSTQTYKHMNSGEGGLLATSDPEIIARAVLLSGSYMLYGRHLAIPSKEIFNSMRYEVPNVSGRMDNLRAAILRPQLAKLKEQCRRWNERYRIVEGILKECPRISLPARPDSEKFVGSSIQFSLPDFEVENFLEVIDNCQERGVVLSWFGDTVPRGYTSRYDSWRYLTDLPRLPKTERVLSSMLDMRIPLTFTLDDCKLIGSIIVDVVESCEL